MSEILVYIYFELLAILVDDSLVNGKIDKLLLR